MTTIPATDERAARAGMSRTLTLLFAVAGGAAVGNLYWAQPLLADIARSLHVSAGAAGLLVTLTQIGYAVGIFLIVPLGDTLNRRRLIPMVMVASAVALLASALAPSYAVLLVTLAAVGVTAVTGQLLVPLASDLACEEERGRVVGLIASGILIGILASRTISGLVADAFGWRSIYFAAAALTFALACVLARLLPAIPARPRVAYAALLRSVFSTVRKHRPVQLTLVIGPIVFAVFMMFWTALTFLLSAPPFSYSVRDIGFVGLAELAGAIAAQRAGRIHDRGWSVPATGAALLLVLVAIVLAAVGKHSLVVLLLAIVLFDIAIQGINILNQTRIFAVDPAARSRLNTAFVVSNFIGGAIGSTLAGILWQHGGWSPVMLAAVVLILVALGVWLAGRSGLRTGTAHRNQTTPTPTADRPTVNRAPLARPYRGDACV
jgi:predicted MFS family arabinose efflux permease